jgi:acyl dehydratase
MRFAELIPGRIIHTGRRGLTSEEIIEFASRYDPQWFHIDPVRAQTGRWKGLIASGWHSCAIAMELAVEGILKDSESFGSPGIDHLKWLEPVRPTDVLQLRVEVLASSRSPSGGTGIISWNWELWNQNERKMLELSATSLFDLSASPQ